MVLKCIQNKTPLEEENAPRFSAAREQHQHVCGAVMIWTRLVPTSFRRASRQRSCPWHPPPASSEDGMRALAESHHTRPCSSRVWRVRPHASCLVPWSQQVGQAQERRAWPENPQGARMSGGVRGSDDVGHVAQTQAGIQTRFNTVFDTRGAHCSLLLVDVVAAPRPGDEARGRTAAFPPCCSAVWRALGGVCAAACAARRGPH